MALDLTALTNPYGQELAGIERNRALATALMQGGQQQPQGQMISGRYIAPSLAQNLNPLLQTAVGLYGQKKADTAETQLANTIQSKQADLLRQYGEAKTPQEKFAIGTNPYAPSALQAATWERLKPQKLGEGETINEYDFGKGAYNPIAQGGEKTSSEYKDYKKAVSDPLNPYRGSFLDYQQLLKRAGASNVTVHTGNALGTKFGEGIGEEDLSLRKAGKNAQFAVEQADETLKNLPKSITGAGADYRLQAAKVFNVLGANNQDTIKASEQAFSQRSQALLGRVKSSGLAGSQGLTEGERKFLTNAYGGTLNLDESTLRGMLTLEKRIAIKDAQAWNQRIKEMPQEVVKGTGVGPVSVPNLGDIDTNNPLLK
jgi:hypothetical protein